MSLERIDASETEDALENRRALVREITRRRIAPTSIRGWWGSYWCSTLVTAILGPMALAALVSGMPLGLSVCIAGVIALVCGTLYATDTVMREAGRVLIGPHADLWETFQKDVGTLEDAIKAFNAKVDALGNPEIVIDDDTRALLGVSLAEERNRLKAYRKTLFTEGFDLPFAPCIEEVGSDLETGIQKALLVEHLLATAGDEAARRFVLAQRQPAAIEPAPAEEIDDIEAQFAALEAADRAKQI
jgi:hypothetical protein